MKTLSLKQLSLEYQQNNFGLQFFLAYNFPIWLHIYITSADFGLISADVAPTYLQLHYVNVVFGNVYLSAGQH